MSPPLAVLTETPDLEGRGMTEGVPEDDGQERHEAAEEASKRFQSGRRRR